MDINRRRSRSNCALLMLRSGDCCLVIKIHHNYSNVIMEMPPHTPLDLLDIFVPHFSLLCCFLNGSCNQPLGYSLQNYTMRCVSCLVGHGWYKAYVETVQIYHGVWQILDTYSSWVLGNYLNRFIIAELLPQTIRGKNNKHILWSQLSGYNGRFSRHKRSLHGDKISILLENRVSVKLGLLQIDITN